MSTSFEVFPTKRTIPRCDEISEYSVRLFDEFMQKEKIACDVKLTIREVTVDGKQNLSSVNLSPVNLTSKEECYTVFNINGKGEIYVFYHELGEIDTEAWNEEMPLNKNAQRIEENIYASLEMGHSWSIKRTMTQPAIACVFYGYLAIAIAILTEGIIYSDDGAWDYSCLPVMGSIFRDEYLDLNKVKDTVVKENIERWIEGLKTR